MLKNILFILAAFLIGFTVTIVGYMYLPKQYINQIPIHLPTPLPKLTTQFSLDRAPSESLSGTISSISGIVKWQSRTADSPVIITTNQIIQQGESIQTATGSATVTFAKVLRINVQKQTGVNVIQTLPAQLVIQQTTGTAHYAKTSTIPVAIRGLDLLVSLESGEVTITVDKEYDHVNIAVQKGYATIAYTDTNNVTQTASIAARKTLVFNNDTKKLIH